jgi:hypothetical protein
LPIGKVGLAGGERRQPGGPMVAAAARAHARRMTAHRIATTLALAAIAAAALAGCGDDDDDTASPTSAALAAAPAAESAYCRASLDWTVHELTPVDDSDPAQIRSYFDEYGAFVTESRAVAPPEIQADWTLNANGFATILVPVLEKYGYSIERVATEGTPEEQALLDEPPADIAAAQDRIQAYDASVCGSRQPPAADVHFDGPAATAYCEALAEYEDAIDEAFGTGDDPGAVEAFVTSPRFAELQSATVAAAPPEIQEDVAASEAFTTERAVPTLERYGYDIRRLLVEGTVDDRTVFQSADPAVRDAFGRVVAYDEQMCGVDG